MLNYSEKIFSKQFKAKNQKEAYLKACKWLATIVISNEELNRNLVYNFTKVEEDAGSSTKTMELTILICMDQKIPKERHCEMCKEGHKAFFINEEYNCNECKLNAYYRRRDDILSRKKTYIKSLLKRSMEE